MIKVKKLLKDYDIFVNMSVDLTKSFFVISIVYVPSVSINYTNYFFQQLLHFII